ncbi:MAG: phosphotransferase [Candidatus Daviesbacteria bacterium]|nr:phosphotransferase [Candidatus Daviesbacteria bacterium]
MQNIYTDYPHINKIINFNGEEWYHKAVKSKNIQYKEFIIQNKLSKTGHVPKCINYKDTGFLEQMIQGKTFSELISITPVMLISLSKTLLKLHNYLNCNNYEDAIEKTIRIEKRYKPINVLELVVAGMRKSDLLKLGIDYNLIFFISNKLENKIRNINHKMTLIHGDVSPQNVIVTPKKKIVIVDWTDCRIDVGLSDLSQAIHLMHLNDEQQSMLLKYYPHPLNFPLFIEFQILLHCLYDTISKHLANKPILQEKLTYDQTLSKILTRL